MGHGWEGAVLRLLRARDFTLTVTRAERVGPDYVRLRVTDGGLLDASGILPTTWVRLWFRRNGRPHQRAYTLVDPDPASGTFSLDFALHAGTAADWARAARPGDTIEATVHGTPLTPPEQEPAHLLLIGDTAALPALNSLLDAYPGTPATVWLETRGPGDAELPVRVRPGRHTLLPVPRERAGARLVEEVRATLPAHLADPAGAWAWIACDTTTTRALAGHLRTLLPAPRRQVRAQGYWRP
ncbi:siderophore-interacting protein [Streptomyces sp. SPB074]|uniref:siderophore-interacting protein n=1 Tax=Streptomyces sp. (strain SPB074) TaxID=465543 RepID=UPI00017F1B8B|nr:siderophore-interacting protein [Streptomyces sp. SPB074]EDY46218.1 iron-chelator utilization protein [Streptomyces sp. SPB074]